MNNSNRDPQDLVDRYLQAVRFWLPASQKQDLTAELSEDLHSPGSTKKRQPQVVRSTKTKLQRF